MKKFFILCLMAFVMCSCNKSDVLENPMVTISFNQQMVTGLPMTKGETNDFLNIIAEQTPTYVNVTLKNLDLDKTFTCKSNESTTIPIGNYEISSSNESISYSNISGGRKFTLPQLKGNTFNSTINSDTKTITLNVYYNCFAVFALIDECKSVVCPEYNGSKTSISFGKQGKYYVSYFQNGCETKITPYDDSNEFISTTYTFSTTYDVNKVYAEYGKYYVIHPQQVSKTTSSFNMELPNMVEGKI